MPPHQARGRKLPQKLVLHNRYSLGDVVVFSAAVRELHRHYPGEFITDVRTSFPALWQNNPNVTPLRDDAGVTALDLDCALIHRCNAQPLHYLHAYLGDLSEKLRLDLDLTQYRGDVHLSPDEQRWASQVAEIIGKEIPFWIIGAGGKSDVTIKWWSAERWQEVVDHFRNKILFVQVGAAQHHHPPLRGVVDLRGRTDLRQLVRLVYHSQGVLCPVTALMHLAAAVPVKPSALALRSPIASVRPCVVVAGGREPVHWEHYPGHQFIHTIGALPCCQTGGCWKSRVHPLGDGDERDRPENLCLNAVGDLPRCMDLITPEVVCQRIELYFTGGVVEPLARQEARLAQKAITATQQANDSGKPLEYFCFRRESERFITRIPPYPATCSGRGVVICGGGLRYFACAWVCIKMLRKCGCTLPIQLWHLGKDELDDVMTELIKPLGVECVDACEIRKRHPARILNGYELKPYTILYSPFQEVLFLDADNVPVVNPEFLFDTPQYRATGAVFWPDYGRLGPEREIWSICGVPYRDEPEFESGQIVVDKRQCWKALNLAMWYNEHSDFFYRHIHGDKDTFHLAFRKLRKSYSMPAKGIESLEGVMCQHDFDGCRIFQHRNSHKWSFAGRNRHITGFLYEAECMDYLEELRQLWDGSIGRKRSMTKCPSNLCTSNVKGMTLFTGPNHNVVLRAPIDGYTGYGLHACQIISDLEKAGYELTVLPTHQLEEFAPIPEFIKRKIVTAEQSAAWELFLHPPDRSPTPGKRTIFFTMWEASRLPQPWVKYLNRAECVVVPCQWNATCFNASGVDRPIRVIPLGINTEIYRLMPMALEGPCVFGTAGKMRGGGERKGLNEVVELFQRAFPSEPDVRLRIKAFPDCGVKPVSDPRVDITAAYLSEAEMAAWYGSLTCFVSVSRSEGWGLMPHQAMAVGRPVIAVQFGGHAEFFSQEAGWPIDYELVPAGYNYAGGGVWAEPNPAHVIALMRTVYRDRGEARRRGLKAAAIAARYPWQRSSQAVLAVLKEFGVVS